MNESIVVGVDIGGSHITAALVDLRSRTLIPDSLVRSTVDSGADAAHIIAVWSNVIRAVISAGGLKDVRVGIAMPGPFDYERGVCLIKGQDKYEALYGLNVKEKLAEELAINPQDIRLMNDAGCFLQGELFGGAAQGYNRAIAVTLGTGLGTATCCHGVAEDADLWKAPFKESIAEDYLSTRWFEKRYEELAGKKVAGVKQLVELRDEDPRVMEIFNEFAGNLSLFLSDFIAAEGPEVVVLGGNIAQADALFAAELQKQLAEQAAQVALRRATLGEEAALIGAASCWY